jgi:hypothetical protein
MLGERPDVLLSEVEGDIGKVSGSADPRKMRCRHSFGGSRYGPPILCISYTFSTVKKPTSFISVIQKIFRKGYSSITTVIQNRQKMVFLGQ